jgi:transposase
MSYRPHAPAAPMLIGYDPYDFLPEDHLCRLVDLAVDGAVTPPRHDPGPGQPKFDPRLLIKVLIYGYSTGVRASRRLEECCRESLPYLFLTRGERVSYHTLCTARTTHAAYIEQVWMHLLCVAAQVGIRRVGHIVLDSTKIRANASTEAVLTEEQYEAMREELQRILKEAEEADRLDEEQGRASGTSLGQPIKHEQMRDILRRVRARLARARRAERNGNAAAEGVCAVGSPQALEETEATPSEDPAAEEEQACGPSEGSEERPVSEGAAVACPVAVSAKMQERLRAALEAIKAAEEAGRKQVCLTDPDARMMTEGRQKGLFECYAFEVAVDNGLIVAGGSTQEGCDNARLGALVEAARANEPEGVERVDADSGYWGGDMARVLASGIDTCIPDSNTACDLHRGLPIGTTRARTTGSVEFVYDHETGSYRCPEGNWLRPGQERQHRAQRVTVYRAEHECTGCPRAGECLRQKGARHRTLKVSEHADLLGAALQRFNDPAHVERYHHRGEAVETVFAAMRTTLNVGRWLLRGDERVRSEAKLLKAAYQVRKVHTRWAAAM